MKVVFDVLTYLLATYGFICLAIGVVGSIRQRLCSESSKVKMVLMVMNQESTIEGIIRNIFAGDVLRKVMTSERLSVVDMGSQDKTVEILKKLGRSYDFFEIVEEKDKNLIFLSFEENKI